AYVALINAHKARLKDMADDGNARAGRALNLANDATRVLASQQVVILLLHFTIALVTAVILIPPLHDALAERDLAPALVDGLAYGGVMLLVAILTLVFGEMVPSNVALGHADELAIWLAGPVGALTSVLAPLIYAAQWISSRIAKPFVGLTAAALVTEEEIKMMVDAGSEGGAIEVDEKEMIYSIFQFGDTLAREVMVPRIDMVALDISTPLPKALETIVE